MSRRIESADWAAPDADFDALLRAGSAAQTLEPDNVIYRFWLNVWRWHAISRDRDPRTGRVNLLPAEVGFTRRIVGELDDARRMCPTYGPATAMAGQLMAFVLGEPSGLTLIQEATRLAPNNAVGDAGGGDGRRA